MEQLYIKVNTS